MGLPAIFALAGVLGAGVVTPSGVELERLADSSYDPPGIAGSLFFMELVPPRVCGERVLFSGVTDTVTSLTIYAASPSGVEVIADPGTPYPPLPGENFRAAQDPDCDGSPVYFSGIGGPAPPGGPSHAGIHSWHDGELRLELATGTLFGGRPARSYTQVEVAGADFAVGAVLQDIALGNREALVLKRSGEAPRLVADGYSSILPGFAQPPQYFNQPVFWRGDLYFTAYGEGYGGIYRWSESEGFARIADSATYYPAAEGTLRFFRVLTPMSYGLVFTAQIEGNEGIYGGIDAIFVIRDDGELERLIGPGDLTVDGETLKTAWIPSGAGSLLTFTGRTVANPNFDAIFVRTADGLLKRILAEGETLEGRRIAELVSAADDRYVGIQAQLTNPPFDSVIYRAAFTGAAVDVPLSSRALAALAAALAVAALGLLRRPAS